MIDFATATIGTLLELPEVARLIDQSETTFEVLGIYRGGCGVCLHLRSYTASQEFALKCPLPEYLGDAESIHRFEDEIQVWYAATECPLIVECTGIVRINEVPSVLSPWMAGGDLGSALPDLSIAERFRSIVRTARALRWAYHSHGLVHRDLKPRNILLDGNRLSYVADWGLARLTNTAVRFPSGESALLRPDRTQVGAVIGTIAYMSPEQLLDPSGVDCRADIYALGCIMHFLEKGTPPFLGRTLQEIALQHLNQPPPKLGGWWHKTALGLEGIMTRCLQKRPADRYLSYADLENDLLIAADKRGIIVEPDDKQMRRKRLSLRRNGRGLTALLTDMATDNPCRIARMPEELDAHLERAHGLIALGRYEEASLVLAKLVNPVALSRTSDWELHQTIALNYAFCLSRTRGKLRESLGVFRDLGRARTKPAEYYVNYSLALLNAGEYSEASSICESGLSSYPGDPDLLGNYTIALIDQGRLDEAEVSAMARLESRRDVHSLEEAAGVLCARRERIRNSDLPQAIQLAQREHSLIQEGLSLNPSYGPLLIKEIRLFRFAHSSERALQKCQAMLHFEGNLVCGGKQLALVELANLLIEAGEGKKALELMGRSLSQIQEPATRDLLLHVQFKYLAEEHMLGHEDEVGRRLIFPALVDYFLSSQRTEGAGDMSPHEDGGLYRHPVDAARILDWIGRREEAIVVLHRAMADEKCAWDAQRQLILLLLASGESDEAFNLAQSLVRTAPWRAESYDLMHACCQERGHEALGVEVKAAGDDVYSHEMRLFAELRQYLEA